MTACERTTTSEGGLLGRVKECWTPSAETDRLCCDAGCEENLCIYRAFAHNAHYGLKGICQLIQSVAAVDAENTTSNIDIYVRVT